MNNVFQALESSTFYDNTIVLFTSDHGELLGAHGGLY
nr:sulfatase-like hydrolase/transferase [Sporosarcina sp. P13]